jgi:RNA polymerase sigma-70 factor (ECF subfamily)
MAADASMNAELQALLERCAQSDAQALSELYRRTSAHLLGCLLRILRRRALAEEALQDVFVQVWQRAVQFQQQRGNAYAWLLSIARYRAIDILRRERAAPLASIELVDTLEANDGAVEGAAHQWVLGGEAALESCLARLNDEQRESIQLAFVNGRSHPEVAAAMNRPLGSVKSWIRRGLAALKECLESCEARTTN